MKKTIPLLTMLFAVILLVSLTWSSGFANSVTAFTLPSLSTNAQTFALPSGTQMNGTVSPSASIRFFISDPHQVVVVNLGIIDKPASFEFTATEDGNYTLNFENGETSPTKVSFSYATNPPISNGSNSSTPISLNELLTIIGLAAAALILVLYVVLRRKISSQQVKFS